MKNSSKNTKTTAATKQTALQIANNWDNLPNQSDVVKENVKKLGKSKHIPSLTALETKVLNCFIQMLYAEAGYSDVGVTDISNELDIPTESIRGVVSSLIKKNIVWLDDRKDEGYKNKPEMHIIYLHGDYYFLHPRWSKESGDEYVKIEEPKTDHKKVAADIVDHAKSVAKAVAKNKQNHVAHEAVKKIAETKVNKVDDPKVAKTLLKSLESKTYQELAKLVGKSFLGKSKQQLIQILIKNEKQASTASVPATKGSKKSK